jgi:hypothetical protein
VSDRDEKLKQVHNKLILARSELEKALNLLTEARTGEPTPSQLPPPGGLTPAEAVKYVVKRLPQDVLPDLVVSAGADGVVTVMPKRWLEDAWGDVNAAVGILGGSWVRAGKQSHWRVPSKGGPLT